MLTARTVPSILVFHLYSTGIPVFTPWKCCSASFPLVFLCLLPGNAVPPLFHWYSQPGFANQFVSKSPPLGLINFQSSGSVYIHVYKTRGADLRGAHYIQYIHIYNIYIYTLSISLLQPPEASLTLYTQRLNQSRRPTCVCGGYTTRQVLSPLFKVGCFFICCTRSCLCWFCTLEHNGGGKA